MKVNRALRKILSDCLTGGDETAGAATAAAPAAFERLRERLSRVIGAMGFEALVRRSIALARAEHPEVRFDEATLTSLAGSPAGDGDSDLFTVTIMSNLVSLLATFIGETLSRKILQEVWPQLATAAAVLVFDEESSE
jgi:hypothetical protein